MLQVFSPRGVANRRAERPLRLSLLLNAAARKREVIVRKVSYEDGPAFSSTRETKRWLVVERRQLFSVNTFSPRTFPRNFRRTRRTRRGAVRPRKLPLGARRETVHLSSEQSKKFTGGNYIVARLFKLSDAYRVFSASASSRDDSQRKPEGDREISHGFSRFEPF